MSEIKNLIDTFAKNLQIEGKEPLTVKYYVNYVTRFFQYTNLELADFENFLQFK